MAVFNMNTSLSKELARFDPDRENIFMGFLGALLGAAIGGGCIILLALWLNYVSAISGIVLAICTVKGYELLGRKRGIVGTIICIALMLVIPYLAQRTCLAIVFVQKLDNSFADAFTSIPRFIKNNGISDIYYKDMALSYLFTAIGAVGTLGKLFRKKSS